MAENNVTVDDMRQSPENLLKKKRKPQCKPEPEVNFNFDRSKMFFCKPYIVNDYITITQPRYGEIIEFGESNFYRVLSVFTGNTTSNRIQLWDMGIDWNRISNWDLFTMMVVNLKQEDTKLLFGDLDFTKFQIYIKNGTEKYSDDQEFDENGDKILAWERQPDKILYDAENDWMIDELLYLHIREYLRILFDQHPKQEYIRGKSTKKSVIETERQRIELKKRMKKDKGYVDYGDSVLLPMVITLVNTAGFKYRTQELENLGIYELMCAINKFQIIEQTRALLRGMYGGFLDSSKIDKQNDLNWFR